MAEWVTFAFVFRLLVILTAAFSWFFVVPSWQLGGSNLNPVASSSLLIFFSSSFIRHPYLHSCTDPEHLGIEFLYICIVSVILDCCADGHVIKSSSDRNIFIASCNRRVRSFFYFVQIYALTKFVFFMNLLPYTVLGPCFIPISANVASTWKVRGLVLAVAGNLKRSSLYWPPFVKRPRQISWKYRRQFSTWNIRTGR